MASAQAFSAVPAHLSNDLSIANASSSVPYAEATVIPDSDVMRSGDNQIKK